MPARLVSSTPKRAVRRLTDAPPVTEPARQQAAIAAAFADRPAGVTATRAIIRVRLTPSLERRLHLAREVMGQSSQQIIAEALDAFLGSRRALEALAKAMPAETPARRTRNGRFP